jgi:hypothetical protein
MFQRMVPVVLLGALCLLPITSAQAQTTVNYTFEDGVTRGDPTQMKVPPQILTENGNKFTRITGSRGDKESIPASYPDRNRSYVAFTSHYTKMPTITDANRRQTYSARIRYGAPMHNSGVNFELYQDGPVKGGYGTADGRGPVMQCWRGTDARFNCRAYYASGTKGETVFLGYVALGTWHTYTIKAVWSDNPSQGRLDFYFDGQLKRTLTGRPTNQSVDSNRLPMFKLGMYGDNALGHIDVDNVQAGPSSALSSLVALSAPTNVRVVPAQ